jgi:hypothetical protein
VDLRPINLRRAQNGEPCVAASPFFGAGGHWRVAATRVGQLRRGSDVWQTDTSDATWTINYPARTNDSTDSTGGNTISIPFKRNRTLETLTERAKRPPIPTAARELLEAMAEAASRRCYCPMPFIARTPRPAPLNAEGRAAQNPHFAHLRREEGLGTKNWRASC